MVYYIDMFNYNVTMIEIGEEFQDYIWLYNLHMAVIVKGCFMLTEMTLVISGD